MIDEIYDRNGVWIVKVLVGLWVWAKEPMHPLQNSEPVSIIFEFNSTDLRVEQMVAATEQKAEDLGWKYQQELGR